ncbi:hypothetical protein JIN87_02715 [Pelagicoccus mobilis]|uniref:Lipocalin-like domain-containing protein n=1 Tax=Pelagicoccus mobilis TaxID=415221 RepID=A0A934RVW0_9BACT|nr:hypothetical protein [Pelagicoccus mobilis]
MKNPTKSITLIWIVAFLLVGCSTTESPSNDAVNGPWHLAPDLDTKRGFTLHLGMDQSTIREHLGRPYTKRKKKNTNPLEEKWTYIRKTPRGLSVSGSYGNLKSTTVTQAYLTIIEVKLRFIDGKLVAVETSSLPADLGAGTPRQY